MSAAKEKSLPQCQHGVTSNVKAFFEPPKGRQMPVSEQSGVPGLGGGVC